jgi:uncharacterized OsmC-like protein
VILVKAFAETISDLQSEKEPMATDNQTQTQAIVVNGVDVNGLLQTVEAVKANPVVAKFRFELKNEWVDGGHNRSTVNEFHGAGQDISRTKPFTIEADEPPVLLGQDQAPNPVEYLLKGIAACVTSSMVYHAAARGIEIQEIESTVEGDIDLRGFLGLDKNVRNGLQDIRMSFSIRADVNDDQLQELANLGPTFSPVFDSVTKGVPISFKAARMKKARAA